MYTRYQHASSRWAYLYPFLYGISILNLGSLFFFSFLNSNILVKAHHSPFRNVNGAVLEIQQIAFRVSLSLDQSEGICRFKANWRLFWSRSTVANRTHSYSRTLAIANRRPSHVLILYLETYYL